LKLKVFNLRDTVMKRRDREMNRNILETIQL